MTAIPNQEGGWQVDKRVPIALIITLLIQTFGIVWWGATLTARVSNLEQTAIAASTQPERLARVETKLEGVQETLTRVDEKLERALRYPSSR